ncbi:MAG: S41 family peptidase [Verrucomicrobiales bacterium]
MPHPFRLRWLALSFLVGGSAWAQAESPSKTEPDPPAPADAPESADPAKEAGPGDDGYAQIELFTRVLEMVRQGYVDPSKTTYESLINSALEGMLRDLDPHCQFLTPKVYEQLQRDTSSIYEGVGITISPKNETLTIVTVREDGPAARAGVLPGDEILKINGILTKDVGLTEAVNLLRGKPGEKLKLTLNRSATKQLLELEMVREVLKQNSLVDIHLLDSKLSEPYKIGYARLLQFNEPSAGELSRALNDLEQKGMEAFVLDLRNNPGGLLDTAIDIIGEFVPAGTVVLTTEGRPGSGEVRPYRIRADHKQRDREYPVVILINGSSASGSEVVAGALQDLKRAIIVGETSFGKGSVQSVMPLPGTNGKALRMTTAKYYTPSHRTIHENGVIPNISAPLTPVEEGQMNRWFQRDSLPRRRPKSWPHSLTASSSVPSMPSKGRWYTPKPKQPHRKQKPLLKGLQPRTRNPLETGRSRRPRIQKLLLRELGRKTVPSRQPNLPAASHQFRMPSHQFRMPSRNLPRFPDRLTGPMPYECPDRDRPDALGAGH